MKKKVLLVTIVAMFCVIFASSVSMAAVRLIIGTGGLSGTYYPVGGGFAKIITDHVEDMEATVQATGGGIENIRLLSAGEIDFGLATNGDSYKAFNGLEVFKGKAVKNIRGIAVVYPQPYQIVVRADSDIKKFEDIKGKDAYIGPPGSGEVAMFERFMKVHNITYDDFNKKLSTEGDAASLFKDRHVDLFALGTGLPASAVMDVAASTKIRMIDIAPDKIEALRKLDPSLNDFVIPKETYPGLEEDVHTVETPAYLICNASLSEFDVYRITMALFQYRQVVAEAHNQGKNFKLETALKGSTIPLHPGAEKFYKDMGLLD